MREEREWRAEAGQYLGEISALCFLKVPPHFSSLPYLLAGTGSQLLLFDIDRGQQIKSFRIFEGVRVHGIAAQVMKYEGDSLSCSVTFKIIVSGERRVKLYSLRLQLKPMSLEPPCVSTDLILLQLLPRFTHWVLDICFLWDGLSTEERGQYLAVGCSDNSVHIWDICNSNLIFEVRCPERCLLYSMRLWGNEFQSLHIASGTIFNEIVLWRFAYKHGTQSSTRTGEVPDMLSNVAEIHSIDGHCYEAHIVSRLAGHHGSIFCLSWSSDGSKLVSTSDDRSARMWIADGEINAPDISRKSVGPYLAGPMLFGHGARVWDCSISDSLIVTAGEDCTCRVWGLDGQELQVIKEHVGRGIWRCLYDPDVSLLVTAGFDSAIKAHWLPASSSDFSGESLKEVNDRRAEVFTTCIPNISGHIRLMDSKSEYVRCLKFAREDTIYVATNHGYVYHVRLSGSGSIEWTELVGPSEEVPIICMDVLSRNVQEVPSEVEDWVAVGDGKGAMKVVKVIVTDCTPQVAVTISWSAEMERQLLGAYWCRSLGCGFIFTSNPRGMVKLWKWSSASSHDALRESDVHLVAEFMSTFGARIMCLDASYEEEVLVCGDLRGNLVLFPLEKCILTANSPQPFEKIPVQTYFKGAHGISTVSSISITRFSSSITEIRSTGADGCMCCLEYDRDQRWLEFVGMKQIKELSLVETVSTDHYSVDDSANCSYAVGFSSTDFLMWNLHSETKLLQVKCGGWRRPHSYHLGYKPEMSSSFAYVKDDVIYVHRSLVPDGEKNIFPRNLHLQFHGREIHCLCIIPEVFQSSADANPKSSWIVTGCEDGTVRFTRYSPGAENWSTSNLLGEHVGGSAVRSLCFVSEIHSAEIKVVEATNGAFKNGAVQDVENPRLLISVGAKRVLTSWLLRNRQMIEGDEPIDGLQNKYGGFNSSSKDASPISFKWLSTDMPPKSIRAQKQMQDGENLLKTLNKAPAAKSVSTSMEAEQIQHGDTHDNDWRYLSVTAFLVNVAHSRLTVCFVVVSCSDATLTLRAFVLPYRYWFDVACLAPLLSPVLALQHVVIPLQVPHQGGMVTKNAYVVVSGSTDGSIAFWDVTASVDSFMQRVSSLHMEKSIDFQKRPRTGRGSQGGRWWRSIDAAKTRKKAPGASIAVNEESICADEVTLDHSSISMTAKDEKISSAASQTTSVRSEESCSDSPARFSQIKPLHVLNSVHKSGVNCLHICSQNIGGDSLYSIISGGDDQALNFLQFILARAPSMSNLDTVQAVDAMAGSESAGQSTLNYSDTSYFIKFLSQNKAVSAHSSAVKGVWTNGVWVFSTGLDQRVRCWKLQDHADLTEHGHFVTSVPEPEALDVRCCGRQVKQLTTSLDPLLLFST